MRPICELFPIFTEINNEQTNKSFIGLFSSCLQNCKVKTSIYTTKIIKAVCKEKCGPDPDALNVVWELYYIVDDNIEVRIRDLVNKTTTGKHNLRYDLITELVGPSGITYTLVIINLTNILYDLFFYLGITSAKLFLDLSTLPQGQWYKAVALASTIGSPNTTLSMTFLLNKLATSGTCTIEPNTGIQYHASIIYPTRFIFVHQIMAKSFTE